MRRTLITLIYFQSISFWRNSIEISFSYIVWYSNHILYLHMFLSPIWDSKYSRDICKKYSKLLCSEMMSHVKWSNPQPRLRIIFTPHPHPHHPTPPTTTTTTTTTPTHHHHHHHPHPPPTTTTPTHHPPPPPPRGKKSKLRPLPKYPA